MSHSTYLLQGLKLDIGEGNTWCEHESLLAFLGMVIYQAGDASEPGRTSLSRWPAIAAAV